MHAKRANGTTGLPVGFHTCAILDDGDLKCWGFGDYGQLGQGNRDNLGDGPGEMGDALAVVDLGFDRSAIQITAGAYHTCALLDNYTVKCWGEGRNGALGQGSRDNIGDDPGEMGDALAPIDLGTRRTAKSIFAGQYHTCAVLDDESIKCWGYGGNGRLGQGDTETIGDDLGEMGDALAPIPLT